MACAVDRQTVGATRVQVQRKVLFSTQAWGQLRIARGAARWSYVCVRTTARLGGFFLVPVVGRPTLSVPCARLSPATRREIRLRTRTSPVHGSAMMTSTRPMVLHVLLAQLSTSVSLESICLEFVSERGIGSAGNARMGPRILHTLLAAG